MGARLSPQRRTRKLDRHKKDIDHLVNVQQLESLWRTRGNCNCATTGMSTTCPKHSTSCNCGISTDSHNSARICWTCTTSSITLSMYCRRISMVFRTGPWESACAPRKEIIDNQRWTATAETPQFSAVISSRKRVKVFQKAS